MKSISVKKIESSPDFPIVVCGDTAGFSTFVMRAFNDKDHVNEYVRKLYDHFFAYRVITGCTMKLEGDGFLAFHPSEVEINQDLTVRIMKQAEETHRCIMEMIQDLKLPRPEGFRIRISGCRPAQKITIHVSDSSNDCKNENCALRTIDDFIGYSVHLAERMDGIARDYPLVCCQAIYETVKDLDMFTFRHLKSEKRVPEGIFKEDILNLYAFKSVR